MKSVNISGHGAEVIERLVSSGRYESPEHAIEVSVRLLEEEEKKQEILREMTAAAMTEYEEGDVVLSDAEATKRVCRERYEKNHPTG